MMQIAFWCLVGGALVAQLNPFNNLLVFVLSLAVLAVIHDLAYVARD